jgi:hypothetical protein
MQSFQTIVILSYKNGNTRFRRDITIRSDRHGYAMFGNSRLQEALIIIPSDSLPSSGSGKESHEPPEFEN